jgi:hypothetical protein
MTRNLPIFVRVDVIVRMIREIKIKIKQRLETRSVIAAIWKFNLSKTDRGGEVPNGSGIKQ